MSNLTVEKQINQVILNSIEKNELVLDLTPLTKILNVREEDLNGGDKVTTYQYKPNTKENVAEVDAVVAPEATVVNSVNAGWLKRDYTTKLLALGFDSTIFEELTYDPKNLIASVERKLYTTRLALQHKQVNTLLYGDDRTISYKEGQAFETTGLLNNPHVARASLKSSVTTKLTNLPADVFVKIFTELFVQATTSFTTFEPNKCLIARSDYLLLNTTFRPTQLAITGIQFLKDTLLSGVELIPVSDELLPVKDGKRVLVFYKDDPSVASYVTSPLKYIKREDALRNLGVLAFLTAGVQVYDPSQVVIFSYEPVTSATTQIDFTAAQVDIAIN